MPKVKPKIDKNREKRINDEIIKVDKETRQALGDWDYWVKMGHEFW